MHSSSGMEHTSTSRARQPIGHVITEAFDAAIRGDNGLENFLGSQRAEISGAQPRLICPQNAVGRPK